MFESVENHPWLKRWPWLRGLKVELTASKIIQAFKKEIKKEIILPPLQDASSISKMIFQDPIGGSSCLRTPP